MATYSDGPTASSTTSGATLDVTGVTGSVGDLLVLICAADNAGAAGISSTSTSITDAASNTWNSQGQTNRTQGGAAADGSTLSIWTCLVTHALVAATITLNFSPNTTAKAAAIQRAVPDAGCAMAVSAAGPGVTGNTTGRSSGAVSVARGQTIIGASAIETDTASTAFTPDSDTSNGSWSTAQTIVADTGSAGSSQYLSVQRKTPTATGNQTYNTTSGTSRDWALNYLIVYETVSGSLAAADATGPAAFAGLAGVAGTMATTDPLDVAAFLSEVTSGTLAASEAPDRASFILATLGSRTPETKSVRILVRFDWPDDLVTRLWSGNGAFIDADGEVWRGAGLITGLDELERAVNGEAPGLTITLSGVSTETSGRIWARYRDGTLIDAEMRVFLQSCDEFDQPQGSARTVFTGFFANAIFDDQGGSDPVSAVSAEIVNKFSLRRTPNWAVLSDADQKARSAVLNPLAPPDRFAERVSLMENKTVAWPRYT